MASRLEESLARMFEGASRIDTRAVPAFQTALAEVAPSRRTGNLRQAFALLREGAIDTDQFANLTLDQLRGTPVPSLTEGFAQAASIGAIAPAIDLAENIRTITGGREMAIPFTDTSVREVKETLDAVAEERGGAVLTGRIASEVFLGVGLARVVAARKWSMPRAMLFEAGVGAATVHTDDPLEFGLNVAAWAFGGFLDSWLAKRARNVIDAAEDAFRGGADFVAGADGISINPARIDTPPTGQPRTTGATFFAGPEGTQASARGGASSLDTPTGAPLPVLRQQTLPAGPPPSPWPVGFARVSHPEVYDRIYATTRAVNLFQTAARVLGNADMARVGQRMYDLLAQGRFVASSEELIDPIAQLGNAVLRDVVRRTTRLSADTTTLSRETLGRTADDLIARIDNVINSGTVDAELLAIRYDMRVGMRMLEIADDADLETLILRQLDEKLVHMQARMGDIAPRGLPAGAPYRSADELVDAVPDIPFPRLVRYAQSAFDRVQKTLVTKRLAVRPELRLVSQTLARAIQTQDPTLLLGALKIAEDTAERLRDVRRVRFPGGQKALRQLELEGDNLSATYVSDLYFQAVTAANAGDTALAVTLNDIAFEGQFLLYRWRKSGTDAAGVDLLRWLRKVGPSRSTDPLRLRGREFRRTVGDAGAAPESFRQIDETLERVTDREALARAHRTAYRMHLAELQANRTQTIINQAHEQVVTRQQELASAIAREADTPAGRLREARRAFDEARAQRRPTGAPDILEFSQIRERIGRIEQIESAVDDIVSLTFRTPEEMAEYVSPAGIDYGRFVVKQLDDALELGQRNPELLAPKLPDGTDFASAIDSLPEAYVAYAYQQRLLNRMGTALRAVQRLDGIADRKAALDEIAKRAVALTSVNNALEVKMLSLPGVARNVRGQRNVDAARNVRAAVRDIARASDETLSDSARKSLERVVVGRLERALQGDIKGFGQVVSRADDPYVEQLVAVTVLHGVRSGAIDMGEARLTNIADFMNLLAQSRSGPLASRARAKKRINALLKRDPLANSPALVYTLYSSGAEAVLRGLSLGSSDGLSPLMSRRLTREGVSFGGYANLDEVEEIAEHIDKGIPRNLQDEEEVLEAVSKYIQLPLKQGLAASRVQASVPKQVRAISEAPEGFDPKVVKRLERINQEISKLQAQVGTGEPFKGSAFSPSDKKRLRAVANRLNRLFKRENQAGFGVSLPKRITDDNILEVIASVRAASDRIGTVTKADRAFIQRLAKAITVEGVERIETVSPAGIKRVRNVRRTKIETDPRQLRIARLREEADAIQREAQVNVITDPRDVKVYAGHDVLERGKVTITDENDNVLSVGLRDFLREAGNAKGLKVSFLRFAKRGTATYRDAVRVIDKLAVGDRATRAAVRKLGVELGELIVITGKGAQYGRRPVVIADVRQALEFIRHQGTDEYQRVFQRELLTGDADPQGNIRSRAVTRALGAIEKVLRQEPVVLPPGVSQLDVNRIIDIVNTARPTAAGATFDPSAVNYKRFVREILNEPGASNPRIQQALDRIIRRFETGLIEETQRIVVTPGMPFEVLHESSVDYLALRKRFGPHAGEIAEMDALSRQTTRAEVAMQRLDLNRMLSDFEAKYSRIGRCD